MSVSKCIFFLHCNTVRICGLSHYSAAYSGSNSARATDQKMIWNRRKPRTKKICRGNMIT